MSKDVKNKKLKVSLLEDYKMVPGGLQLEVREKLAEAKGITLSNVHRLINGLTSISPAELKEFKKIFSEYINL